MTSFPHQQSVKARAPFPKWRPARVLLVDDDERNLLAVATVLSDLGEVVLARSGEEALRHLLKGEFAVILLDVYMPGMDGYETAQIIRSRDQTKGIPIVFLSAVNKETEHLLRGYSMGAVDYVFKPVDPIVLRVEGRRLRRPVREDQGSRAQGGGAALARKQAAPGPEDGCDRQAHRRDRARFQQSARGGHRRAGPARKTGDARRGRDKDPRNDQARRGAGQRAGPATARVRPPPDARTQTN